MEPRPYSQLKATLSITRASLKAMFRSPSAVIFSLAFPIIFILVFGFIGGRSSFNFNIALTPTSDTTSPIYHWMENDSNVIIQKGPYQESATKLLKGKLDAIVSIDQSKDSTSNYVITIQTSSVSIQNGQLFKSVLKEVIAQISEQQMPHLKKFAIIQTPPPVQARVYQTIDFILPGQLGFSMLSAGVFGAAFVFFNLRQTLVLKRFFATPIKRGNIIIGEGLSRLLFQLMAAFILILIGHFFFKFTLVNGVTTFLEMLFICALGLTIFMGFGFIVSGVAKNETSIPPFANLITLPQFLLAGTFFSIDNFPAWLQPISRAMPLTYMNDAMRKVAFEGLSLWDVKMQLGVMVLWGIIVFFVAVRVFKWE
jgi:ABC-2 type transport system permease protein